MEVFVTLADFDVRWGVLAREGEDGGKGRGWGGRGVMGGRRRWFLTGLGRIYVGTFYTRGARSRR